MKKIATMAFLALLLSACQSPAYNYGWKACEYAIKHDGAMLNDQGQGFDPNDPAMVPDLNRGLEDCFTHYGFDR